MARLLEERVPVLQHSQQYDGEKLYIEWAGLSTDTKPTERVMTGSVAVEVDTSKAYLFDEDSSTWIEVGGSNG